MKNINKITKVVSKVMEISHWVAAGFMAATAICAAAAPKWIGRFVDTEGVKTGTSSVYGFETVLFNSDGALNMKALLMFSIGAMFICALMAMVFRNIYLIIKKSASSTPFNKDNVRMIREIGVFSIAVPIVGLIMSVITRLVLGADAAEISVNLSGFVTGIVVLSLTQVFAYGAELEKDVDGLL